MTGKLTKTEKAILLLTAVFLALTVGMYLQEKPSAASDYTIMVQYEPETELINLNTASAEELETLNGIGPALAQKIIDHRLFNGPFSSVDELTEISGIGESTLAKFRDRVTVK